MRRYVFSNLFVRLVYLLVCRQYAIDSFLRVLRSAISVVQQFNVNSLSLLLIIVLRMLQQRISLLKSTKPSYLAIYLLQNGMNLAYFINLSIIISIALYALLVAGSVKLGRLVIKYINMSVYSSVGIFIACIFLQSACVAYLFF